MATRIGISGWRYPHWRGVFYPTGLRQKDELAFASRTFDTIEVNGSFYSLMLPSATQRWRAEVPDGFTFAIKGSRFITHMKRLVDVKTALANFFASGVLALEETLGPILWQLPPQMTFDHARLDAFLARLPRTTREAVVLAKTHDQRVAGRAHLHTASDRPLRYALEPRHASFDAPSLRTLLARHGVALCIADAAGVHPAFDAVTADWVYVRLHGDEKLYESGYRKQALARWAHRIERWARAGADVYVYFDNDARVRAPFDALRLRAVLRGEAPRRSPRGITRAGEPARTSWPAWRGTRFASLGGRAKGAPE